MHDNYNDIIWTVSLEYIATDILKNSKNFSSTNKI